MKDADLLQSTYLVLKDFVKKTNTLDEAGKINLLLQESVVGQFFQNEGEIKKVFNFFNGPQKIVFLSLVFLRQIDRVFFGFTNTEEDNKKVKTLIDQLLHVESFYKGIGGIIGYHAKTLELILQKKHDIKKTTVKTSFRTAKGLDLSKDSKSVIHAIIEGLKKQEIMAEVYPIGGAGDRLGLISDEGIPLPAAILPFLNKTLLEGLIRDLQAREYLYFKLFSKQSLTPIALMTSYEKNNHYYIQEICKKNNWFGRGEDNFKFFIQPLVPVITTNGCWKLKNPFDVVFKPGGHGMLWKLAEEEKVFDWLRKKGRKKGLIRQINNPIAGIDDGILAFCGWGLKNDKGFGFLSCERLVGAAEGVLVLAEEKNDHQFNYRITNLEYTDFERFGFKDEPKSRENNYSLYPSNTNILFFDIDAVEKVIPKEPIPGLLVNIKDEQEFDPLDASFKEIGCARLESTMQNIADSLADTFEYPLQEEETEEKLNTFIVYNERAKTISVTKRSFVKGKSHLETPVGCYFDLNQANLALLKNKCGFSGIISQNVQDYLLNGPAQIFNYHPALGPLYSLIEQKITQGHLGKNGELQLDIAEVDIKNISIDGSLLIEAINPMGFKSDSSFYSHNGGKVELHNVKIKNLGRFSAHCEEAWKNNPLRRESLKITLLGMSEFYAENINFEGSYDIVVPDGQRAVAKDIDGKIIIDYQPLLEPSWYWKYEDFGDQIKIKKIKTQF